MNKPRTDIENFDLYNVRIMARLLELEGVVDEEVAELLNKLKWEHYSLLSKISVLEEKVNIDIKTGLFIYRDDYLEQVIKTASRTLEGNNKKNFEISYIRIDIDDFSIFNNKYGHDIGDVVLKNVSTAIKKLSRPTDYIIRFGGEEIDILLPNTGRKGALTYLDKLFAAISRVGVEHKDEFLKVTVSGGVTSTNIPLIKLKSLSAEKIKKRYLKMQQEVDNALYEAKYQGKNCFRVYHDNKKNKYADIRKKYTNQ